MHIGQVGGTTLLGHIAQIDGDDRPAARLEQLQEIVAPLQTADLRIRAAARHHVAVLLSRQKNDQIGLVPAGEKPRRNARSLKRFLFGNRLFLFREPGLRAGARVPWRSKR